MRFIAEINWAVATFGGVYNLLWEVRATLFYRTNVEK